MIYTVIYFDENNKRTWIKCHSLEKAKEIAKSFMDSEICISVNQYDTVKEETKKVYGVLSKISEMIENC